MVTSMLKSDFANKFYNVDTRTLMRWIISDTELLQKLENTGYRATNKVFTPLQIAIIRESFG